MSDLNAVGRAQQTITEWRDEEVEIGTSPKREGGGQIRVIPPPTNLLLIAN
jgi:hypothetical protein